jgi:hypothetical protein
MEYIITRTVEFRFTVEADSKEEALINVERILYEEAEQLSLKETVVESIEDYEASLAPKMFTAHPNDKFFIDGYLVNVNAFNSFFDANDIGWSEDLQPDGSVHYTMYRDEAK